MVGTPFKEQLISGPPRTNNLHYDLKIGVLFVNLLIPKNPLNRSGYVYLNYFHLYHKYYKGTEALFEQFKNYLILPQ